MITLEVLSRDSAFNNGLVRDVFSTSYLSINTKTIVSMSPARQGINEVNGKSADNLNFTDIVYSMGSSVERITVLGEYHELVAMVGQKSRRLLNG
tara:strand:+ start:204 stop:488 length:285 start_codon:yes stop_codon:yes gene_type:complete